MSETTPPAARRGTEKRQRTRHVDVRCTEAEFTAIDTAAERAGLTVGAFMRRQAIGKPGSRAKRRPVPHQLELREVLAALGSLGNNVNQLAKAFNTDASTPEAVELVAIRAEVTAMRASVRKALGLPA